MRAAEQILQSVKLRHLIVFGPASTIRQPQTMEPAFTLGILYGCGCGFRTAQYFEQLAAYYLKSMSRVRVLIALTGKAERSVAACLLEQRAKHSGLEVAVVLTARQWREYLQNISHGKAAECNPISDAADRREVMERCAERFASGAVPAVYRALRPARFSRTPCRGTNGRTDARTADGYGRATARAVQTSPSRLCEPALSGRPNGVPDVLEGPYYDPYQEIRQSVAYLRRSQFRDPGGTPSDDLRAQMAVRAAG